MSDLVEKPLDPDNMTPAEAIVEERAAEEIDYTDLDQDAQEFLERAGNAIRNQLREH